MLVRDRKEEAIYDVIKWDVCGKENDAQTAQQTVEDAAEGTKKKLHELGTFFSV